MDKKTKKLNWRFSATLHAAVILSMVHELNQSKITGQKVPTAEYLLPFQWALEKLTRLPNKQKFRLPISRWQK